MSGRSHACIYEAIIKSAPNFIFKGSYGVIFPSHVYGYGIVYVYVVLLLSVSLDDV